MRPVYQSLKRKRSKRHHWSGRHKFRRRTIATHVLHLPTRRTLTYAEAQRFVDVSVNGSVDRLNVAEPLRLVDDGDKQMSAEYCDVRLPTDTEFEGRLEQRVSNGCGRSIREVPSPCTVAGSGLGLPRSGAYYRHVEQSPEELDEEIEYDTDEQVRVVFTFLFGRNLRTHTCTHIQFLCLVVPCGSAVTELFCVPPK